MSNTLHGIQEIQVDDHLHHLSVDLIAACGCGDYDGISVWDIRKP